MSIEQEIIELDAMICAAPTAELLYRRGCLHWKLSHAAQALSDFNLSAALDPAGPGTEAAEHLRSILHFWNPANP